MIPRKKLQLLGLLIGLGTAFCLGSALTFFIFLEKGWHFHKRTVYYPANSQTTETSDLSQIRTLNQLLSLTPDRLEQIDIGLMNLLCAEGLKEAETLDIDQAMKQLDEWADRIKYETEIRVWQFEKHADFYRNSEPLFKMAMLVLGLKEKLGVHYNLENMNTPSYADSSQIFIHGLLGSKREGSCVSLPVLCAAVGRRLGYPVKIVHTAAHTFIRWDDVNTGEKVNIEPSMQGTDSFPDDYYKNWPIPLSDLQLKEGYYLKSLTPAEELSAFLSYRGLNLQDTGRRTEAQIAFAYAYHLSPGSHKNLVPLAALVDSEIKKLWEEDCKLMGSKQVRYTHFSGFSRDPGEITWVYLLVPPIEVLNKAAKKNNVTPQKLLYAEVYKIPLRIKQKSNYLPFLEEHPLQYRYTQNPHQQQMKPGVPSQQQQAPSNISGLDQQMRSKMGPALDNIERNGR